MNSWKRLVPAALVVSAMAFCSGCATSLQPLVTAEVRTDVAEISGNWIVESSNYSSVQAGSKLRIKRRGVGSHNVEIDQSGEKSSWHADTVKLGDAIFVDLFPDFEADTEKPEGFLIIATHAFFVIQKKDQDLQLFGFDHGQLDVRAVEEHVAVSSPRNQRLVFTAEPKRLQEFFAKHGPPNLQKKPNIVFKKEPRS